MRAISAAAVTLLSASALALAAPAAVAGDDEPGTTQNVTSFGFSVTPSAIAPGGKVTLKSDGCDSKVTVSSGVFDTVTLHKGKTATATVDWDAKPGAMYKVTFDCDGEKGTTDLTIAAGGSRPTPAPHDDSHVPKGVKAGIGGSFSDLDFGEIALGAALITGALGTAYHWARKRTGEDEA